MGTGSFVIEVSEANFQTEVIERSRKVPVVVDFWAPWCAPCKMIAPELDELADELVGQVKVAKVNVDDHPEIAGSHSVAGIPTLVRFDSGKESRRISGARRKAEIKTALGF